MFGVREGGQLVVHLGRQPNLSHRGVLTRSRRRVDRRASPARPLEQIAADRGSGLSA